MKVMTVEEKREMARKMDDVALLGEFGAYTRRLADTLDGEVGQQFIQSYQIVRDEIMDRMGGSK